MLNQCEFEKLAEACGNRYAAIKWLSKQTRKLYKEKSCYKISEAKMLTWALTGKCPYSDSQLALRKHIYEIDNLSEILEFVTDKEVINSVRTFYILSVRNKKLTLCDTNDLGENRLARVNILLRMAWYNFK